MSLSKVLTDVRSILSSDGGLTAAVPANKITLGRRPQRDNMPGITYAVGNVDYDETKQSYAEAISYRVDITIYCDNAGQSVDIHGRLKNALVNATSDTFDIRILDERYFVDVDDNHLSYVSVIFKKHDAGYESLLDKYSKAVGAYSLRRLKTDYDGPAITVRKTVNGVNTSKDIYFDGEGNLDVTALKDFVGSADGRVSKWWDQSGRNNHAVQTTLDDQPYIVNSGVVVMSENRPALELKADAQVLDMTHTDFVPSVDHLDMYVVADTGDDDVFVMFSGTAGGGGGRYSWVAKEDATDETDQYNTSHPYGGFGEPDLFVDGVNMNFVLGTNNRADVYDYISGRHLHVTEGAETNAYWSALLLNGYNSDGSSLSTVGKFQEIIIYNTSNSSNRPALERDMAKYYSLGHPKLLDIEGTSDARACFSTRLMKEEFRNSPCMRVRRDGQSDTHDIYWDEFGNLDVVALEKYANGRAVYVQNWFDQSGGQRDFFQVVHANQPQICDDTGTVLRQNNYPALRFVQGNSASQSKMSSTGLNGVERMDVYVVRNPGDTDYILFHGGDPGSGPFSYVVDDSDITGIQSYWFSQNGGRKIYYNDTEVPIEDNVTTRADLYNAMVFDELALEVNEGCSTATENWEDFRLCGYNGRGIDDSISEIVIYDSDKSAYRTQVQDNINEYYHLY